MAQEKLGVSCELIDLQTILPWDVETVCKVRKTCMQSQTLQMTQQKCLLRSKAPLNAKPSESFAFLFCGLSCCCLSTNILGIVWCRRLLTSLCSHVPHGGSRLEVMAAAVASSQSDQSSVRVNVVIYYFHPSL